MNAFVTRMLALLAFVCTASGSECTAATLAMTDYAPTYELEDGVDSNSTMPYPEGMDVTYKAQHGQICAEHWRWFHIKTVTEVSVKEYVQQLQEDGTTIAVEQYKTQKVSNALTLTLDAGYLLQNRRFSSMQVFLLNGSRINGWANSKPDPSDQYDTSFYIYTGDSNAVDRVTWTIGVNETDPSCHNALAEDVYVAIGCSNDLKAENIYGCDYSLRISLLPNKLLTDTVFETPVGPSIMHFFRVPLLAFDVMKVTVTRLGSNKFSFVGGVYIDLNKCPSNETYRESCEITNMTGSCETGVFCTDESNDGSYVLAVQHMNQPYPETTVIDTSKANWDNPTSANFINLQGWVGPYDTPIDKDVYNPSLQPLYQPGKQYNEMLPQRGAYRMEFIYKHYLDGTVVHRELRPGCVSFGQWRYYHIDTTGATDATLMVEITPKGFNPSLDPMREPPRTPIVSGLYIKRNQKPTLSDYDGLATAGTNAISISPCMLDGSHRWYIGVYLDTPLKAESHGLKQSEYDIIVRLQDAVKASVLGRVEPRSVGGDGYLCCGVFKYYVVRNVDDDLALQVHLNVTKGHVRALYMKHETCPRYPEDIFDQQCGGKCEVSWLTVYNSYDGSAIQTHTDTLVIPHGYKGSHQPDKRAAGDWYIAVQALSADTAEFMFETNLVAVPPLDTTYKCEKDRFCPQEKWKREDDNSVASAPLIQVGVTWALVLLLASQVCM